MISTDIPRTYPHGVPNWVDTEQPDVDAAMAFYGELFGWTFEDMLPPDAPQRYAIAHLDGQDVGGFASVAAEAAAAVWNVYIASDGADATLDRAVDAGGTVLQQPADAGPAGRSAAFTDAQGAELRLWQAGHRLGAQVANQPGAWVFNDLRTPDPEGARRYYEALFGWVAMEMGEYATMLRRPGYGEHLRTTVDPGILERQAEAPDGFEDAIGWIAGAADDAAARWNSSFGVADRDAAVATAERLGATVVGTDENQWTRTADVRDPQGAPLTLSQFLG